MLLAAGLTLTVPLVGWQSVQQLYTSLLQTRIDEQTLKVANMRLALSETTGLESALQTGMTSGQSDDWYAETSPYPIFIDGYEDDWQTMVNKPSVLPGSDSGVTAQLRIARHAQRLYLFVSVTDDIVEYHVPPAMQVDAPEGEQPDRQAALVNGDSVELLVQTATADASLPIWEHAVFRSIAPGPVEALRASDTYDRNGHLQLSGSLIPGWQAAWVQTQEGYQLELGLPLPRSGMKIGLSVVDVDVPSGARNRWAGSLAPRQMQRAHRRQSDPAEVQAGLLIFENTPAKQRLQGWTTAGNRSRLYDVKGRLLADVNRLYDRDPPEAQFDHEIYTGRGIGDAILRRVFAFFVAGDLPLLPGYSGEPASLYLDAVRQASLNGLEPVTTRYVTDENDRVLGTLAAVGSDSGRGYLLYESNEEHSSAYAGSELARLFSLLLLVSLLAGSGLLIFALVLSSRIRRLSQEAQSAVTADGRVKGLPGSDARDEIGDLSRKLSTLLARSAAYTHYLEALSSRLSHELRTPLSVVRTSIENIDREQLDEQSLMLIDRASGGAEHLGSIIKALVDSTRLEQTVQLADRQRIDLLQWLQGSLARYRQVYPEAQFESEHPTIDSLSMMASPELLSQAFDKLVDNAVSFTSTGKVVLSLSIERRVGEPGSGGESVLLLVNNEGARLDEAMITRLFEPMFSDRRAGRDPRPQELHLGLGLYIVKMIADVHQGSVVARNDKSWVRIGMYLPVN